MSVAGLGHAPVWFGFLLLPLVVPHPPASPTFRGSQEMDAQGPYAGQPAVGDHDPGTDRKMRQTSESPAEPLCYCSHWVRVHLSVPSTEQLQFDRCP